MGLPSKLTLAKWVLLVVLFISLFIHCQSPASEPILPRLIDESLTLELVDSHPNIVTPIGLAIDPDDALYFLESHTHTPPADYQGKPFDVIKKGIDKNQDGLPEDWIIFADSITDGMNLAVDQNFEVFLVQKDQVVAFRDTNSDGRADVRRLILQMVQPASVYDHAGLLGITTTREGWLYISRGNTGGARWQIEGRDGSRLDGFGDGGNIFRCRKDGSDLQALSTGYWNPFDLTISDKGRLLAVDNDPDSRGPNRLLDVVPGADFGYQSLYGGSGIHPFLAWNGELPGTLPYAAGLGEAPSGIIDASFSNFDTAYRGQVLVSIWEENNIVAIPLRDTAQTIKGTPRVLIQGDSLFHPVAFAVNSLGHIYFTDWVVRQYPNHGQGRLWRLRGQRNHPIQVYSEPLTASFATTTDSFSARSILQNEQDPFLLSQARWSVLQAEDTDLVQTMIESSQAQQQVQGLLLARQGRYPIAANRLNYFLEQDDPDVLRLALIYIAMMNRTDKLEDLEKLMIRGKIPTMLFETYLETIKHLQPSFVQGISRANSRNDTLLARKLPPNYLSNLLSDPSLPAAIRAATLPYLKNYQAEEDLLIELLLQTDAPELQEGIIMVLRQVNTSPSTNALLAYCIDDHNDPGLRALALVSLLYHGSPDPDPVLDLLLTTGEDLIALTSLKVLCQCQLTAQNKSQIVQRLDQQPAELETVWKRCQGESPPFTNERLMEVVKAEASAERGKIIFHLPQSQCMVCHQVNGWGGTFGPGLTNIGASKSPKQLALAILDPSAEISPEWQAWFVTDADGNTHLGRQIDVHLDHVELMEQNGAFMRYDDPQNYGPATTSLMPVALHQSMTVQDFSNLISYLSSLN